MVSETWLSLFLFANDLGQSDGSQAKRVKHRHAEPTQCRPDLDGRHPLPAAAVFENENVVACLNLKDIQGCMITHNI